MLLTQEVLPSLREPLSLEPSEPPTGRDRHGQTPKLYINQNVKDVCGPCKESQPLPVPHTRTPAQGNSRALVRLPPQGPASAGLPLSEQLFHRPLRQPGSSMHSACSVHTCAHTRHFLLGADGHIRLVSGPSER